MASSQVQLTSAMRANLLQLQKAEKQIGEKQTNLSTGNKVNSALDGPTSYFSAKGLNNRAGDLSSLKEAMGQGISTITAANKGLESISKLVETAKGLTTSAYSSLGDDAASVATRKSLAAQFNTLKEQIDKLASDSGYSGKNLINGDGQRMDSTAESRKAVNTIVGVSNAKVTNVVSADTYQIRIKGTGNLTGKTDDISDTEDARGFVGLKISGTLSSSLGSFSDVTIQTRGSTGRLRTFSITDGDETRTVQYFDNSQTMSVADTTIAKSSVGQVSTVAVSGTIEAGDIFTIKVEGQTFSYTASAADVAMGQVAKDNIASKLRESINTALSSGGRLQNMGSSNDLSAVSVSNGTVTLHGNTDATRIRDVTFSATTENALTKDISESFASGTVVKFTIDRKLMEAADNSGSGTSTIQKMADVQVEVTNLQGETITRDGAAERGSGKLSEGANSFSFDSGTVRVDIDENKIKQAASANKSASIVTVQVASANTQNDLTVQFNENNTNSITVEAENLSSGGQGLRLDYAQNDWMDRSDIDEAVDAITFAQAKIRSASQNLSTNLNIVTTREDYTKEFSDVLTDGANKLTQADQNDEGAQLLMLQTRQQLGVTSLSLANQSQQSILKLF